MTELQKVIDEMRGKLRFRAQTDNGNVFVSIAEINDWASRIEAEQHRTGEPVAWLINDLDGGDYFTTCDPSRAELYAGATPLYTHPPADAGMGMVSNAHCTDSERP